jgi:hypothetical protein
MNSQGNIPMCAPCSGVAFITGAETYSSGSLFLAKYFTSAHWVYDPFFFAIASQDPYNKR